MSDPSWTDAELRRLLPHLRSYALHPDRLQMTDLEPLRPFFDLVRPGHDLYGQGLWTAAEADSEAILTLLQFFQKKHAWRVTLVENGDPQPPWLEVGTTSTPGRRDFGHRFFCTEAFSLHRRYTRTLWPGTLRQVRWLLAERFLNELASNLRASFTDGLEDEVFMNLEHVIQTYVLALLLDDRETAAGLVPILTTLVRCAPLGESLREPGMWYVFVRADRAGTT